MYLYVSIYVSRNFIGFKHKQDSKNWDPWPRFVCEFDFYKMIWFDSKWFDSKWFDSKWFDSKWISIFYDFSIFHDFEKGWQNDEKWRKLKVTTIPRFKMKSWSKISSNQLFSIFFSKNIFDHDFILNRGHSSYF